jgi:hypothetical protein
MQSWLPFTDKNGYKFVYFVGVLKSQKITAREVSCVFNTIENQTLFLPLDKDSTFCISLGNFNVG